MNCKLHKSHKPIDCVIGFENMEKNLGVVASWSWTRACGAQN